MMNLRQYCAYVVPHFSHLYQQYLLHINHYLPREHELAGSVSFLGFLKFFCREIIDTFSKLTLPKGTFFLLILNRAELF